MANVGACYWKTIKFKRLEVLQTRLTKIIPNVELVLRLGVAVLRGGAGGEDISPESWKHFAINSQFVTRRRCPPAAACRFPRARGEGHSQS